MAGLSDADGVGEGGFRGGGAGQSDAVTFVVDAVGCYWWVMATSR